MNTKAFVGCAMVLLILCVGGSANANLVTNGDFESGDTGFFTDYSNAGIGTGGQTYSITTDPSLNHPKAGSYGDHTSGSGNMMAVNGAETANQTVWGQNVNVDPNTWYEFSIYVSSWSTNNFSLADLSFSFNLGDVTIGGVVAPDAIGIWEEYKVYVNSGSLSGSTSVSFVNNNIDHGGNDFAVDDISLMAVPEPSSVLLMAFFGGCVCVVRRRFPKVMIGMKSKKIEYL